jgi:hypothetical protein
MFHVEHFGLHEGLLRYAAIQPAEGLCSTWNISGYAVNLIFCCLEVKWVQAGLSGGR